MIDRDLVVAKIETLERCLARIDSVRKRSELESLDRQELVVLSLQRATQSMIDLAAHVVARERLGVPDDLAHGFTLLHRAGIIDADLADRMRRMTGFRNVAVHEYRAIDPAIVETVVRDHLGDLRQFATAIVSRFHL